MRSGSANAKVTTAYDNFLFTERSLTSGGLIGDLINEIEARLAETPSSRVPIAQAGYALDIIHLVSIAAGYIGLGAGFAIIYATLVWLSS